MQSVQGSMVDLTTIADVVNFLRDTPYATEHVERIKTGMTNFVYRLHFDRPLPDGTNASTAILKYYAQYIASEPNVPLSSNRQLYEVKAMTDIPWRGFRSVANGLSVPIPTTAALQLPALFHHDPQNRIVVMEDCARSSRSQEIEYAARAFLGRAPVSSHRDTAQALGERLGCFLAELHNWGRENRHTPTVSAFAGNISAKNLVAQETFHEFFQRVEKGAQRVLQDDIKAQLSACVAELKRAYYEDLESVLTGDLWLGNVLLAFNDHEILTTITIIDWEFTMLGPAFIDIGWFLAETFADYFDSGKEFYLIVAERFAARYQESSDQAIDMRRSLEFCSLHLLITIQQRIELRQSLVSMDTAGLFMDKLIRFITSPMPAQSGDFLSTMLQLLKESVTST